MTIRTLTQAAILSASFLFAAACNRGQFDEATDGTAGFFASELGSMNDAVLGSAGALGKTVAGAPVEAIITRSWDTTLHAFIRTADVTFENGTRHRVDTVTFYGQDSAQITDSSLVSTQANRLANVRYIHHARHVSKTFQDKSVDIDFDMHVELVKGADTTAIRNGLITGTFEGDRFDGLVQRTRKVTDVTWKWINGQWDKFPISGTIEIDRPLRTIVIEFTGNGTATATVTRKSDNEVKTITITVADGVEK
jgi:hypothetical protein